MFPFETFDTFSYKKMAAKFKNGNKTQATVLYKFIWGRGTVYNSSPETWSSKDPVFTAGHLRYFLIFSLIKNDLIAFFINVNFLFLHQSYLKSLLPIKKSIVMIEKIEKYPKCPPL